MIYVIEFKIMTIKKTKTKLFWFFCDREGIRTPNPQSRNLIFYPVELRSLLYCVFILQ